jgi:hypothetical protein
MHDRAGNLPPLPGRGARGRVWAWPGEGYAWVMYYRDHEIVGRAANEDGIIIIRFLTQHGEFVTSEQDFRFWIERLSASVV